MPINWNEIKSWALSFSKEWANDTTEDAEAKLFSDGCIRVENTNQVVEANVLLISADEGC